MTEARYTGPAVALHWAIALLIFCTFPLGLYMADLHFSLTKLKLFSYHKWIGVTIFALAFLRLAWRASHRPPPFAASVAPWQQRVAHWTHGLLYLLIFIVPLSGWLYSSATGIPTVYLGLLQLPDLVGKSKPLADDLRTLHYVLNCVLLALVTAHVAAALKHQLIDHDGLLRRMWPARFFKTKVES